MFDDFVVIERTELKKYNKKKKIEKEEQIKDSGSSTALLIAKPGSNPDTQYKLEDFQIKKVIDKGSFGKVFLVVNKHDK